MPQTVLRVYGPKLCEKFENDAQIVAQGCRWSSEGPAWEVLETVWDGFGVILVPVSVLFYDLL